MSLAQGGDGVLEPALVERGPGLVVADVDVHQAAPAASHATGRRDQLVERHRQRSERRDLAVSAPVGATVTSVDGPGMTGMVSRSPERRNRGTPDEPGTAGTAPERVTADGLNTTARRADGTISRGWAEGGDACSTATS